MDFVIKLQQRTGKNYLSYSSVKEALSDLRDWELYMLGKKYKDSAALTFGSYYDTMLFEPEKVEDRFVVMDESKVLEEIGGKSPRATTAYKKWVADIKESAEGKQLISEEDHHTVINMISRLDECGLLESRLRGKVQTEFYEFIEDIPVRGFLDVLGDGFITDSKSSRSVLGFKKDVFMFGYDIQAYIYTTVFNIKDYYWVAQDKTYPYLPAEFKASEETIERGGIKFWKAVSSIRKFLDGNEPSTKYYLQDIV